MGNLCGGMNAEQKEAALRNKAIEEQNKLSFEQENEKIKLLLLGAGESGKSTLFKQMKILYPSTSSKSTSQGFSREERAAFAPVILQNIVFNLTQVLAAPSFSLKSLGQKNKQTAVTIQQIQNSVTVKPILSSIPSSETSTSTPPDTINRLSEFFSTKDDNLQKLSDLWKDPAVEAVWNTRSSLQVQDTLEWYLSSSNLPNLFDAGWLPSDDAILRSRVRTSGILEQEFNISGNEFMIVDVGGQRNERRKWLHAFEDVDCVLFVCAISEFDQKLYEDTSVSRQQESIELFGKVVNEYPIITDAIVLFLNKFDLFRDKLTRIPFRKEPVDGEQGWNEDYTGAVVDFDSFTEDLEVKGLSGEHFEEVVAQSLLYVEQLYRAQVESKNKQIYVKTTCATDTQQIRLIMAACRDVFLRKNLKNTGFM